MMRKSRRKYQSIAILLILLSALLLSACQSEDTAAQNSSVSSEGSSVSEKTDAGSVSEGTADSAADAEPVEQESGMPDGSSSVLYSENGLDVQLIKAKDPDLGSTFYTLMFVNGTGKDLELQIQDVTVNEIYQKCGILHFFDLAKGQTYYQPCIFLNQMLSPAELEEVTDLSFVLAYTEKDKENWAEEEIAARPVFASESEVCVVPYMDAKAEEQVLLDSENVRITLLFCGRLLDRYGNRSDQFYGMLRFDNKKDDEIPIGISAAAVNRISMNPTADLVAGTSKILPAGKSDFLGFYLYDEWFAEQEITSIASLSLMLLTDYSEVTGNYAFENSLDGGSWYDVVLSVSGTASELKPEGEPVFDNGSLQIYYTGQSMEDSSYGEVASFTGHWKFRAFNSGEETVEIDIADVFLNGERDNEEEAMFGTHAFSTKPDLAPGTGVLFEITLYNWPEETIPKLAFRFRMRSAGGGSILYEAEESCVIEPE